MHLRYHADFREILLGDCLEVEDLMGGGRTDRVWAGEMLLPRGSRQDAKVLAYGGGSDWLKDKGHLGVDGEKEAGSGLDFIGLAVGGDDGLGEVETIRVLVGSEGEQEALVHSPDGRLPCR